MLEDCDIYNPNSPKFDPIRAIEYAASPIHYIVGRDTTRRRQALFVSDLRNATFSRDLTRYTRIRAGEQRPRPKDSRRRTGAGRSSSIAMGAAAIRASTSARGPTCRCQDHATFDAAADQRPVDRRQRRERDDADHQRRHGPGGARRDSRLSRPLRVGRRDQGSQRDGLYVAANFNYLRGFLYENDVLTVNLVTDRHGPARTRSRTSRSSIRTPAAAPATRSISASASSSTSGRSALARTAIANRIDWTGVTAADVPPRQPAVGQQQLHREPDGAGARRSRGAAGGLPRQRQLQRRQLVGNGRGRPRLRRRVVPRRLRKAASGASKPVAARDTRSVCGIRAAAIGVDLSRKVVDRRRRLRHGDQHRAQAPAGDCGVDSHQSFLSAPPPKSL